MLMIINEVICIWSKETNTLILNLSQIYVHFNHVKMEVHVHLIQWVQPSLVRAHLVSMELSAQIPVSISSFEIIKYF